MASKSKKLGPVEKNHSNVRKMISVFESSSLSQVYRVCCLALFLTSIEVQDVFSKSSMLMRIYGS